MSDLQLFLLLTMIGIPTLAGVVSNFFWKRRAAREWWEESKDLPEHYEMYINGLKVPRQPYQGRKEGNG